MSFQTGVNNSVISRGVRVEMASPKIEGECVTNYLPLIGLPYCQALAIIFYKLAKSCPGNWTEQRGFPFSPIL